MELKLNIGFKQLFNLAKQLPQPEKQRLIAVLQKTINQNKGQTGVPATGVPAKGERELGKYKGKIQMSEDFNAPLDDFKEYM